ncbi:myrcene synthase, chloroplastic-like [Zingiber officinale]|uniref:myrcene synthase, chloroplastic-like n=1 Tax=Zingiber officinale TaxID=94328 RepID=UPI001C4DA317|nr:myrcene synthase, chloroplastic-like [Zingiber officinale]
MATQSLTSTSAVQQEDSHERINVLKKQTRNLIREKQQVVEQLQLIDHLQQLGMAYHFKDELADHLKDNLHATSLMFRLLRANGFSISQYSFEILKDEKLRSSLCEPNHRDSESV